jgi:hypothetical protein
MSAFDPKRTSLLSQTSGDGIYTPAMSNYLSQRRGVAGCLVEQLAVESSVVFGSDHGFLCLLDRIAICFVDAGP